MRESASMLKFNDLEAFTYIGEASSAARALSGRELEAYEKSYVVRAENLTLFKHSLQLAFANQHLKRVRIA